MLGTYLEQFEAVWECLGKIGIFGLGKAYAEEATQTQYDPKQFLICKLGWIVGLIKTILKLTEHNWSL